MVVVGYEMNAAVAREVNRIAATQVVILNGNTVAVSTLNPEQTGELSSQLAAAPAPAGPADWRLGKESYVASALVLNPGQSPPVTIMVLKSYDRATAFLNRLQNLLLAIGLGAVLSGSLLVYLIAGTFTRPLEKLVEGVRALGGGDFRYPLHPAAASEVSSRTCLWSREVRWSISPTAIPGSTTSSRCSTASASIWDSMKPAPLAPCTLTAKEFLTSSATFILR